VLVGIPRLVQVVLAAAAMVGQQVVGQELLAL
jgi:hypothetical protein